MHGQKATCDLESSMWRGKKRKLPNAEASLFLQVLRLLMPKPYFQLLKPKVGYSYLCDYWSLGVAFYYMLYGYLPFRADSKGCILDKVGHYTETSTTAVVVVVMVVAFSSCTRTLGGDF